MTQITSSLQRQFESSRIVFWIDTQKEWSAQFEAIDLPGIEKVRLENQEFGFKRRALRLEPAQKFLVYRDQAVSLEDNWLLDMELGFATFQADPVSLWMLDVGLDADFRDKSKYALDYVSALGGTTVWPVHCVKGTAGLDIDDGLADAISRWHDATSRGLVHAAKGEDPDLEYFGVFAPEYNSKEHFNETLARQLLNSDLPIVVAGEARSHCVRRSVEQLVQYIREQDIKFDLSKIVLLEDCMSDVTGFEALGKAFFTDMAKLGVTITKSSEIV